VMASPILNPTPASNVDEDGKPVARRGPGSAWTLADGVFYVRRTSGTRSPLKLRARSAKEAKRWVHALNRPRGGGGLSSEGGENTPTSVRRSLDRTFYVIDD